MTSAEVVRSEERAKGRPLTADERRDAVVMYEHAPQMVCGDGALAGRRGRRRCARFFRGPSGRRRCKRWAGRGTRARRRMRRR